MAIETTSDKTTRARNLKYTYRNRNDEVSDKFTDQAISVIVTPMVGDKPYSKSLECKAGDLFKDKSGNPKLPPAGTGIMCTLFGAKTTTGNAVTGLKDDDKTDPEKVLEAITTRWENIVEGEWREGREGGPQLKYVLAAVCAVLAASQGSSVDAAQEAAVKAEIIKTGTKAWLDDATIKAEFDAQAAKRLTEQAKVSAAAASAAKGQPSLVSALLRK